MQQIEIVNAINSARVFTSKKRAEHFVRRGAATWFNGKLKFFNKDETPQPSFTVQELDSAFRQKTDNRAVIINGPGVYIIKSAGLHKIGCTSNVRNRMVSFLQSIPTSVELAVFLPTRSFRAVEWTLHQQYRDKRVRGEWFNLTSEDLVNILDKIGFLLVGKSLEDFLSERVTG